jgi:predicted phage terminase large subunit-like protein
MTDFSPHDRMEMLQLLELEVARSSLEFFTKATFPDYEVNWHHRAIFNTVDKFIHTDWLNRLMIFTAPRHGKALAVFTPILTTDGWKTIGDLTVGDFVFGIDGKPTEVIAVSEVFKNRDCYVVETDDNYPIIADKDHIWNARLCRKKKVFNNYTTEFLASRNLQRCPMIKICEPIDTKKNILPIPPYTLGLWLGDGAQRFGYITKSKKDLSEIEQYIEQDGFDFRRHSSGVATGILKLQRLLIDNGLLKNKHIPDIYFEASIEDRTALLQGLIDTDGYVADDGQVEFCSMSKTLAIGVQRLVWSLGRKAFIGVGMAVLDGKEYGQKYRVTFYMKNAARLKRKAIKCRDSEMRKNRYLKLYPAFRFDTKCIQVKRNDGLFLVGHAFVVTHNSEIISRRLPAFIFGNNPDAKVISCSYSADLAGMINRDVQRIIDLPEYKRLFPKTRLNSENVRTQSGSYLRNSDLFEIVGYRGQYRSAGVGGGVTGMGCHYLLIDDPIKNQEEADSPTMRQKVWDWYTTTAYTRLEKNGKVCLVMTRWHQDDLAGRLLSVAESDHTADQWVVLNLPAICENPKHPDDQREVGDPLWPNKYDLKRLEAIRSSIGQRAWSALFQQRPSVAGGNIFKSQAWQYWRKLPEKFDAICQSWDLAFKNKVTSDFVAGHIWAKCGADFYLVDRICKRLSFTESCEAIKNMTAKWPQVRRKLVEAKANGDAVVDHLKHQVPGLILVEPHGGKTARANAIAPYQESGNLYLPAPDLAPWVNQFIDVCENFPNVDHDDDVDAMSQAILHLGGSATDRLRNLLKD